MLLHSCNTLAFASQALLTIRTRDTRFLSLKMYIMMAVGILSGILYGYNHGNNILMMVNIITFSLVLPILIIKIRHSFKSAVGIK